MARLNRAAISTDKLPTRFNGTPCENDDREIKGLFSEAFPPRLYEIKRDQARWPFVVDAAQRWIALDRPDNGSLGHGLPWNRDNKLIRPRLPTDFNGLCKWEERVIGWELFRWPPSLSDRWSGIRFDRANATKRNNRRRSFFFPYLSFVETRIREIFPNEAFSLSQKKISPFFVKNPTNISWFATEFARPVSEDLVTERRDEGWVDKGGWLTWKRRSKKGHRGWSTALWSLA